SLCTGMPNSCASAAISATGCTVPTSLLAHITLTSATEPGSASMAARTVSGWTRPTWSTSSQVTLAPSCVSRKSTQSRTAWCSTTLARIRTRRGSASRRAQKVPLMARVSGSGAPEVKLNAGGGGVRLGAPGGEDPLGGAGAQGLGNALAGLLGDPTRATAGGVQGGGV